ncbi:ferric reductase-like transmembrane domain-containing protein [Actinomycetospora sp. NBRC 106375]|uniref:ferric reductase-like transmembrane domain-containing protein n=1 Tax=Actinomycetospora sp. NBRC 106375 TaxID=3032207 RepID=UPI002556B40D|nr:ferric reductase-like transmembrane domain-containing protein [Actinomycetospora sp. NBRC 106375]
MSKRARRTLWSAAFALLLLGPPAAYLAREGVDPGKLLGLAIVLSGIVASVAMVLATIGASRIRALTTAIGIDRVMSGHRWLGVAAFALVVVHLVVAIVRSPKLLNPLAASLAIQFGWFAFVGMIVLSVAAAWGRRRGTRYEWWARLHVVGAALALALAGLHIVWLGDLLSDPVMRVVCSVLAAALLVVLARRWVWQPLFSQRGAYVVYGVRDEGGDVATLALTPVFRRRALRFAPGQFVWLRLHRRVVGVQEHPFTIASSAELTDRLELTIRASGDFSRALARMQPGRQVWLDGPHGSFTPDAPERVDGLVLVAGGVGITPMMSMLRTLAERGDRRLHRLVLAERPDQPLFGPELEVLSRRLELDVLRTAGRRVDADLLAGVLPRARGRLEYYVCGPPGLLSGSLAALEELGVPPGRIHSEQFGWTGPLPVTPAASASPADGEPAASTGDVPRPRRPRTGPVPTPSSARPRTAQSPADRFPTHPSIPLPAVDATPDRRERAGGVRRRSAAGRGAGR